ncbi:23S rRNA pseudouridine(955/2504/2580) synthase RluC [Sulfuriflexus mobilis]|uniref:23S rRNA pseudouridine(955/2504/2580) synthase RluC n=1 Tax=Sulfuriflexus mobilis TaxID=1811807 RepID=UPI000F8313A2|nr:23S rRNA pseudouridine(955/2504/2580) synthase RluC [Sulfuriflexus mobilis]
MSTNTPDTSPEQRPAVRLVDIEPEQAGQRIDNFLITKLKGVPKSRIYRILRKGEVRVNKGRIKPEYRLKAGDQVRIPPIRMEEKPAVPTPPQAQIERLEAAILFEDKGLIIINKPSGLAVHGGSGLSFGLIEVLRASRPTAPYLELVHRLDRDTSGLLLVAKKRSYLRSLHEQLRGDGVRKHYRALLCGHWDRGKHHENAPLYKNTLSSGERIVRVDERGKTAHTLFKPISCFKAASYMEVELFTGRTHQIRVHAAHAGHPVAGDEKYGNQDCNRDLKRYGLKRLFLHAYRLEFTHPGSEQPMDVIAPLDNALGAVLDALEAGQR